ncbi:MAG TPA: type II toxin-antitoxin system PemK/MazF family toxin [Thermomicrobiales bacterium]|nr:type II toxin-antitoxin system PemK/MazF family toxin [Thermomicrobiales bacterium]
MPDLPQPSHGEVWTVVLDPEKGHEQGGARPAVVISNDRFNRAFESLIIVVQMTRTNRGIPTQIPVDPPEGGLTAPSFIMCEQVRAVSIAGFRGRRGAIRDETMMKVEVMLPHLIARLPDRR